jgi:hypothetical protein
MDGNNFLLAFNPADGLQKFNCSRVGNGGVSGAVAIGREGLLIAAGDMGGITAIGV